MQPNLWMPPVPVRSKLGGELGPENIFGDPPITDALTQPCLPKVVLLTSAIRGSGTYVTAVRLVGRAMNESWIPGRRRRAERRLRPIGIEVFRCTGPYTLVATRQNLLVAGQNSGIIGVAAVPAGSWNV